MRRRFKLEQTGDIAMLREGDRGGGPHGDVHERLGEHARGGQTSPAPAPQSSAGVEVEQEASTDPSRLPDGSPV